MFRYLIALVPPALFVVAAGAMGWQFAETLGHNELTRTCWRAVALGSAVYCAIGLGVVRDALRAREYARAVAAFALFLACAAYEVAAAYGFAHIEGHTKRAEITTARETRARVSAKVALAEADYSALASAPDVKAAKGAEEAIAASFKVEQCQAEAQPDRVRRSCAQLAEARADVARAEAKMAARARLEDAKAALAALPPIPAGDARAELLGDWFANWLPVVVVTAGAFLGFFATGAKSVKNEKIEKALESSPEPAEPPPATSVPTDPKKPVTDQMNPVREASAGTLAAGVAGLLARAPALPIGISVVNGELLGTQRAIAAALGLPVASVNRKLRIEQEAGLLLADTTGRETKIRLSA